MFVKVGLAYFSEEFPTKNTDFKEKMLYSKVWLLKLFSSVHENSVPLRILPKMLQADIAELRACYVEPIILSKLVHINFPRL